MTNNLSMPLSPVVDDRRNAQPEWRRYLSATSEAIGLLKTLIQGSGGSDVLEARIAALAKRVNDLAGLAASQRERLVIYRGVNDGDGGTRAAFNHGLGTEHLFWHFRDTATGVAPFRLREIEQNEGAFRFRDDDINPLPATLEATFIGVISDRY